MPGGQDARGTGHWHLHPLASFLEIMRLKLKILGIFD